MARRLPKPGTVRVGIVTDPPDQMRNVTYLRPKGLGGMWLDRNEATEAKRWDWVRLTWDGQVWKCEVLGPTIDEEQMRLDLFGHNKYGERPG